MPTFDPTDFQTTPPPTGNIPATITSDQVPDLVTAAAKKHGVDPQLALAVARTESHFDPIAHNKKSGAHGVMQLMPKTAEGLGVDINNPSENIEGGVRYLKQLLDKHKGDTKAALTAYGGFKTEDPTVYVNTVMNGGNPPTVGKTFDPSEFEQPKEAVDYSKAALEGKMDPSMLETKLTEAGKEARPYVPWALGGVVGALYPPLAPFSVPATMLLARGGEQAGLAQSGQISKEQALQRTLQDTSEAAKGEIAMQGLAAITSPLARWVNAKRAGIDPNSAKQVAAVADMTERNISSGFGRKWKLTKLKDVENKGIDSLHQKWGSELASKREIFGDTAAHYIKDDINAPLSEVEAALGPKGAAIVEQVRKGKTLSPGELESAIFDTNKSNAWGNFFGRKNEQITLDDLRNIKQNLQGPVPYGQTTEGLPQARKVVASMAARNIAKNIPDATDAAAYKTHADELEKLINIEELPGFKKLSKNVLNMYLTAPLAGGIIGGASGYYSHQDPWAAAGRAGLGAAMAASPPTVVHLLNSPWARQIGVSLSGGIKQAVNPSGTRVNYDPETIKKIQQGILKGNEDNQ